VAGCAGQTLQFSRAFETRRQGWFAASEAVLRQKHIYLKTIALSKAISDIQQHAQGVLRQNPIGGNLRGSCRNSSQIRHLTLSYSLPWSEWKMLGGPRFLSASSKSSSSVRYYIFVRGETGDSSTMVPS
jgi:hypothetical protein